MKLLKTTFSSVCNSIFVLLDDMTKYYCIHFTFAEDKSNTKNSVAVLKPLRYIKSNFLGSHQNNGKFFAVPFIKADLLDILFIFFHL